MAMPAMTRYVYNVQLYFRKLLGISDGPLHILRPIRDADPSSPEILLVLVQGAFTPAEAYLPLANAIQEASQLRLWIAVPTYFLNLAVEARVRETYTEVLRKVKAAGFGGDLTPANIFIGGHSAGGMSSRAMALKEASGFIQMAAYFDQSHDSLPQHPKPVLVISGERDGQMVPTVIAEHAGQIAQLESKLGEFNTVAQKPVVIVPGMNHAQFSHGTPNLARGDFPPDIGIEEARATVGSVVASFLEIHVNGRDGPAGEVAYGVLKSSVEVTHGMFRPFWEARESQQEGLEDLQVQLAFLGKPRPNPVPFRVVVTWHDFVDNFIYSKPKIDGRDRLVHLSAMLKPQGRWRTSATVSLKMKSREAIEAVFSSSTTGGSGGHPSSTENAAASASLRDEESSGGPDGWRDGLSLEHSEGPVFSAPPLALETLAANFNAQIFAKALALVSEAARKRYLKYGVKLVFLKDRTEEYPPKWVEGDVEFKRQEDQRVVEVTSPIIRTPLLGIAPRLAGMHYIKVITLSKAMEFILIDGLR